MQQISIILQTINQRKLGHKFSERHYELLISVGLTRSDQIEFRKEVAKKKSTTVVSSTLLEESEEESEADKEDIDFDKSIRIEASVNHMDRERKFLEKYIKIKIIQLRDLLQSTRTLGYEFTDSKLKGSKGDKTKTDKNKVFSVQKK